MRVLDADHRHLALREALLRSARSRDNRQVISPSPLDSDLEAMIASVLPEPMADILELWPAGTSAHVDHRVVAAVGRDRWQAGRDRAHVGYYDDVPYFARDAVGEVSCTPPAGMPALNRLHLTNVELAIKAAAVNCYASQLPALFGRSTVVADDLPTEERFWINGED